MEPLEVRYDDGRTRSVVGRLISHQGVIHFEYTDSFRALELELSPHHLPVELVGPVTGPVGVFQGLHGLFNDSLPDGWGVLVMSRALARQRIDIGRTTPLDRLAFIGTRGMGALTYHPASHELDDRALPFDLAAVAEESERVVAGSIEELLPAMVRAGGSPMGARPKILAGVSEDRGELVTGTSALPAGYTHWLIKFASKDDPADVGRIESAYAAMARVAGITFPETHVFTTAKKHSYFGVTRFDRGGRQEPDRKVHVHTMSGLLHHDHRNPGQDYLDLLRLTQALTHRHEDVVEAYRRAAFNVLACNRDDHTKNVAYTMDCDGEWRLAPAYDVTYSTGPGGEHTMMVAGEGNAPTYSHLEQLAEEGGLSSEHPKVIEQVAAAVADWRAFASAAGVTKASTTLIDKRLAEIRRGLADGARNAAAVATAKARRKRRGR